MSFISFSGTVGNALTPLAIASGGSGQTTAAAALNAFGGAAVAGDIGGTSASPTVVSTHLASALPIAQGGTAQTARTAPAVFKPGAPTATSSTSLVMAGIGSTVLYTPTGSGTCLIMMSGTLNNTTAASDIFVSCRFAAAVATAGTTVAAGSNGGAQISTIASWAQPSAGVLDVASTAGFASSGTIWVQTSGANQPAQIAYTSITGGGTPSFNGCTFTQGTGTNTIATGNTVSAVPINGALAASVGTVFGGPPAAGSRIGSGLTPTSRTYNFPDVLTLVAGTAYWFDFAFATAAGADAANLLNISVTIVEMF